MPLILGAKVLSLKELCVKCIIENLNHWCNKPISEVIEVINPELASSPFDELPTFVLKKIVDVFEANKGSVKMKYLELLLSPQLDSLDLTNLKEKNVGNLLYRASIKCMHLKKLQLCGLQNVGHYMVFFLPKFQHLQILEISNSEVGDHCLHLLGVCCKDLRELNVSDCKNITDKGIKGLCVSVDYYGREDSRLGQCKLIEKLSTHGTNITKVGKKIILDNLHALKIWDAVHFDLLSKLFESDPYLLKDPPKYCFIQMELKCFEQTLFRVNSLKLGVSLCPFLTKVKINAADGLMDSELLSLLSLKNLRKLKINGFNDGHKNDGITFIGGIIPLLKCFGNSLEKLGLSHLHSVNIPLITQFCPKLRSLTLVENWSYSTVDGPEEEWNFYRLNRTNEPILPLIEKLRLDDVFEQTPSDRLIPPDIIFSLLSLPTLTDVSIFGCVNLTDEILQKAAKIHYFQKLVYLKICCCSSVTKKGIDVFFSNRNPLKKIELTCCLRLTNEDVRYWRRLKREENWLLDISFRILDFYYSSESESVSELSSHSNSESEWSNEWGEEYCESDSDIDSVKEWADTDNVDVKNL